MSDDTISRQAAIDKFEPWLKVEGYSEGELNMLKAVIYELRTMPSAQPTLYGYRIEHLAYIARVMQKEGVTAEYAVRTFDDISRAIRMIIDEAQQKTEEMLNERFNRQTGGD